jgi:hypothetical protein
MSLRWLADNAAHERAYLARCALRAWDALPEAIRAQLPDLESIPVVDLPFKMKDLLMRQCGINPLLCFDLNQMQGWFTAAALCAEVTQKEQDVKVFRCGRAVLCELATVPA